MKNKKIPHRTTRKDEGLLPAEAIYADKNDRPWTRKETDELLNNYLTGLMGDPARYAHKIGRSKTAVTRQIDLFHRLDKDSKIMTYAPTGFREDREGVGLSTVEERMIKDHIKYNVPLHRTSAILQRPMDEIVAYQNSFDGKPKKAIDTSVSVPTEEWFVQLLEAADAQLQLYVEDQCEDWDFGDWLRQNDMSHIAIWWETKQNTIHNQRRKLRAKVLARLSPQEREALGLED